MRIIAGSLKGRRLDAPDWHGLRPTSDKLRETLFNVLAPRIEGARLLDGYAGTGAVGIEALSRGAGHVTFVERDPRALKLIEANLERCGVAQARRKRGDVWEKRRGDEFGDPPEMPEAPAQTLQNRYAIIRASFPDARKRMAEASFDIVFLDPPYGQDQMTEALAGAAPLVGERTVLVVEHAKRDRPPDVVNGLSRTRELISGDSALSFFARVEQPS
jgi:16S rRNA (guanine966-N2)-methyltransferase